MALKEYTASISNSLHERNVKHQILQKFEKLAVETKAPFSNILHAFLANQYYQYQYAWNLSEWQGDYNVKSFLNNKEVSYNKIRLTNSSAEGFFLRNC